MSDLNNRKWVIITLADYTESEILDMIANAIQTSIETLRKTTNSQKAILKWDWDGETPSCFDGMVVYSHSEIRTELAKDEW